MNKTVKYHDKTTPESPSFLLFGGAEMQAQTVKKPQRETAPKNDNRARMTFDAQSEIAPPAGFDNRETWLATVWLNGLANAQRVNGRAVALPSAEAAEIRRWFYHRWQEASENRAPSWIKDGLVGIGSLGRVNWHEVAAHYKRCPWADVIQDAFKSARDAGLPVDRSPQTTFARRNAIAQFIARPIATCRELRADEWRRVGLAIENGELRW